jgi:hypothetical protein
MPNPDIYHWCETDPVYDPQWHWITDQIALGSYPLDPALNEILESGITASITLLEHGPDFDTGLFDAAHVIRVYDRCLFPYDDLVAGLRFLHTTVGQGRKVYVHCFAGISRSAFLVSCYLMLRHNIPFPEAVARVQAIRSICSPHPVLYTEELLQRLCSERESIIGCDAAVTP